MFSLKSVKAKLGKKVFDQKELQEFFFTLERPTTSRKYYIVHTTFQFFHEKRDQHTGKKNSNL